MSQDTATRKDEVAAAKASLELTILENKHLQQQFSQLLNKLEGMEKLPQEARHQQFRELEKSGQFLFKGVDVRHFQPASHRPLPPHEFLVRTQRRLQNTITLLLEFKTRGAFDRADELKQIIFDLTSTIVDEANPRDVKAFRRQVEEVRQNEVFQKYMETKKTFISQDPTMKTEVEFLAAKENIADQKDTLAVQGQDLARIHSQMEAGEIDPQQVLDELDNMGVVGNI